MFALHAVALALALGSAACEQDPCERTTLWLNGTSAVCTQCQSAQCSTERMALSAAATQPDCVNEFNCTARCPSRSSTTCGCYEQCLVTPACQKAFDDLLDCASNNCDRECGTGVSSRPDAGRADAHAGTDAGGDDAAD